MIRQIMTESSSPLTEFEAKAIELDRLILRIRTSDPSVQAL